MSFYLFPGQGSQTPGMGRDFYDASPAARAVFDQAETMAGPGLLETIFEGPAEKLGLTHEAQPALLVVEVAIARHLETQGHAPSGCAGHSFGEFPALVAAGALTFEDALRLSVARGKCMSENVPEGGMAAVIGLAADAILAALPGGVEVANFNGPGQTIISGTRSGLEAAEQALKEAGAKRVVPLKVAGPFHTSHMGEAQTRFREALDSVEIAAPRTRFVSSVNGEDVSDPAVIRTLLAGQICKPVRWTDVMNCIGAVRAFEVGPGRVLQGLCKRTDGAPAVEAAGTMESANGLEVSQ